MPLIKKTILTLLNEPMQLDIFEKTESTNDYLRKLTKENTTRRACIADMQTNGKGQLNRSWHSPAKENIYFSLLYPTKKTINELSGLSLVVGLATSRAIENTLKTDHQFLVKWPNDILYNQQKIAGILIETQTDNSGLLQIIIGVGINVNMQEANEADINQPWSSLQKITGQHIDRNTLCAALINHLLNYLDRFFQAGLMNLMDEWQKKDCLFGEPLEVVSRNAHYTGIGVGINTQGHLLLRMEDNTVRACSSGDTTLRK